MSNWLRGTWAVFRKDLQLELRHRYALNTLLMFVLSVIGLMLFSIGNEPLTDVLQAVLFWIVVLFAAAIGLGRSFIAEEERGTVLLLKLNVRPSMVYAGKLFFNFAMMLVVEIVAVAAFYILLNMRVENAALLALLILLGALGLAGATTLLAAIIARAATRGPLLPVLLFPLLIPLLLAIVGATVSALDGTGWAAARDEVIILTSYAGVVISASIVLFDFVWND